MAKNNPTPVGARLLKARTMAALSQTKLAEAAGVSQSTIAQLESGRRAGDTYFFALADALGVDARWLALGEGASTKPNSNTAAIAAVAGRCELTYHSITALYDLCGKRIAMSPSDEDAWEFVILRESLRGIARDMENCAETLNGDPGGLGYFAMHYGSV